MSSNLIWMWKGKLQSLLSWLLHWPSDPKRMKKKMKQVLLHGCLHVKRNPFFFFFSETSVSPFYQLSFDLEQSMSIIVLDDGKLVFCFAMFRWHLNVSRLWRSSCPLFLNLLCYLGSYCWSRTKLLPLRVLYATYLFIEKVTCIP